ncbi:E3 ubiquitin-protein ligase RNF180 isoform X2 [Salvelinus sp. IW2-2015]|uniref:E3 ubiquitin-protein ligase RNF180 isoform X2 n=1 Tax=Salvelinus sp. IW2-2015 TaxID=2691554 RepID=UPI0038D3A742
MDNPGAVATLRCRKCRKGFVDTTCLHPIVPDDDTTAAGTCSVWHMNVDTLPEWILTSVHQAQWTVGKLNCENCGARLGGFNFLNNTKCPCGQESTVHLSKSRVDQDHKRYLHVVRPQTTRGVSHIPGEQEEERRGTPTELQAQLVANNASPAIQRFSKREKNRLKSQRRKQRKKERWLHSQEQSVTGLLTDSEEVDREGYTCAVCLDVYFSPYSCHPCGHIFCEPCLRTLAKNRPANTPCPLCRTLISHTLFQKELNQTAKNFFPKVYHSRKHNFQKANCAKWPLPNCRKRFRIFWGYQGQVAPGRWWHFAPAGFALDALDLADMRGWFFDIDLVIIYIHSVNWILALLVLCFLAYFFLS